jgi:hypothetical protein
MKYHHFISLDRARKKVYSESILRLKQLASRWISSWWAGHDLNIPIDISRYLQQLRSTTTFPARHTVSVVRLMGNWHDIAYCAMFCPHRPHHRHLQHCSSAKLEEPPPPQKVADPLPWPFPHPFPYLVHQLRFVWQPSSTVPHAMVWERKKRTKHSTSRGYAG